MKLRNWYLVYAGVSLLFALGLLLMSNVMLGLFGMDLTRDAAVLCQLIGVELSAGGMVTLLARDVTDAQARSAINYANMAAGALGLIIALNATLTGVLGWFGWAVAAIYLLMTLGFAYFQFFAPPE